MALRKGKEVSFQVNGNTQETKKKCLNAYMLNKKTFGIMFLRDFEKKYGQPEIGNIRTSYVRPKGIKTNKEGSKEWDWGSEFYAIEIDLVEQFESNRPILTNLARRTVELALNHKDEILTIKYKKANLQNLDTETINFINSVFENPNIYLPE